MSEINSNSAYNVTIRTRFAPSPTGYLHIGGARTALFSWLYARKMGGQFILRIEDTDRERSTQEAIDAILDAMEWLGLSYDEGPYYQMQRLKRYHEIADKLIADGHAYRCTCTKERLEALRVSQTEKKIKPRYDGFCRDKNIPESTKEAFVIRFRTPDAGTIEFNDDVHGEVSIQNTELDDLVLIRSDGVPTYNFGVVVDDLDMKITHVIRGDDHLANTPRQINILKALGGNIPTYAHVPMILGPDGKRLSKRHGAVSVQHYRDQGILPKALLNDLVRLGWSHGDQEIFSIDEMISFFELPDINKAAASFNYEKLLWLNQHYIKTTPPQDLIDIFKKELEAKDIDTTKGPPLEEVIKAQQERAKTLKEMAEKSTFFYKEPEMDKEAKEKNLKGESLKALAALRDSLAQLSVTEWKAPQLHNIVIKTAESMSIKLGKLAQPLRVAVTGNTVSPPIDITLELIGRERVLKRLENVLDSESSKNIQ